MTRSTKRGLAMVHFCIFGSREGAFPSGNNVYVTLFGSCEQRRPPMAQLAMAAGSERERDDSHFFFTVFGSASIRWPTLAAEYVALLESLRSGKLTLDNWDRLIGGRADGGGLRCGSCTIFGGLDTDEVPNENDELDDLSVQQHAGRIPERAAEALMLGIGHHGVQRLAAVRHAVAESMT